MSVPPDQQAVADALPFYEIHGELGRGGWGVVLAGRHRQLNIDVAIKQVPRLFSANPAVRARFKASVRAFASFDHPHIIPIYDYVEDGDLCVLVMERLTGGTVASRMEEGKLPPPHACAVVATACAALHYAHQRGVLHRDVKPSNLMFSGNGVVKVSDFGLAHVVGGDATWRDVQGTAAYMAPEQAKGGELTPAADIYAIGTVLYELLAGQLPFPSDGNPATILYRRVHEEPLPLRSVAPGLPAALAEVTARALERDPERRYASAEQLADAIAEAAASGTYDQSPSVTAASTPQPTTDAASERTDEESPQRITLLPVSALRDGAGARPRPEEPEPAPAPPPPVAPTPPAAPTPAGIALLRRHAEAVVSNPRRVLAAAFAFLIIAAVLGGGVADQLKVGGFEDPRSGSSRAQQLLDDRFGGSANLVVQVTARRGDVDEANVQTAAERLARQFAATAGVNVLASYWASPSPELRSVDGRSGVVALRVAGTTEERARQTRKLVEGLPRDDPAVEVHAGGPLGLTNEIDTRVDDDLVRSEAIAVPATLVLLVLVFGGVIAGLMPLAMGVFSIVSTWLVLLVLSKVTDVSVYALTVATAFGLGLAIDFGLLMVSRFREERDRGHPPNQAVVEAVATAGEAILFSAATVTVAMASMLVFPVYFLRSVGLAAIVVVVVAAIGAVVVLPAMLALAGDRIDSLVVIRWRNKLSADSPFWRGMAARVMRRPMLTALPVVGLLLLLAVPFLHARFAPADERALPSTSRARQVTTDLRRNYPTDRTRAITVVAPTERANLERLAPELSRLPGVLAVDAASGRFAQGASIVEPGPQSAEYVSGDSGYLSVMPSSAAESDASQHLVRSIRALPEVSRQQFLVGGQTASSIDFRAGITHRLGLALAIVATAMFLLLFLFTKSIVVPVKALLLNLLALGAVLGAMVWLFQDGNIVTHLGVTPAPLNLAMVVLLCTIVFGLSVDYEIFLLSRIMEARDQGANTIDATVAGLGHVGRIVSAAAALLTVTLFSFSIGLSFMKMFGIGTGLAILLDATLIRGVLVPAFMRVAGDFNWWAPRFLRRFVR